MLAITDIWLIVLPVLYVVSKWLYEFTSQYYPPKEIAKGLRN